MEVLQAGPAILELTRKLTPFQSPPQKALGWQVTDVSINAGKTKNVQLISGPGVTSAPTDLL